MHLQVQTADGTRRLTLSVQDPNAWENMAVDVFDKLGLPAFASSGQDQGKGRRGGSRGRSCSPWNSSGDGEDDDEEEEENEEEGIDDDEEEKSTRGLGGQDIMRGDTLERISRYITPRSLQRLACTCTHLRWFCSTDEAWRPWLKRLVASPGRNETTEQAEILDRYLSRWRSSSSTDWPPLRTVFTKRCAARLKVRRAVGDVAKFGGGTARLRPPLTEEELLNLEQSHNCVLPDSLREMYLSFDGEHTEWGPMGDLSGWGGGLANGLRLLPLVEALSHDSQSLSELPLPSPERWREAHSVGHLEGAFAGDKDEVMSDAIPLTSTAGFGTAGERYVCALSSGQVYMVSGLTVSRVGDVCQFLHSLVR